MLRKIIPPDDGKPVTCRNRGEIHGRGKPQIITAGILLPERKIKMKMYRGFVTNEKTGVTYVGEKEAENLRTARKAFQADLQEDETLSGICEVVEPKERKKRETVKCTVTFAWLEKDSGGICQLKRGIKVIPGTSGKGERAEYNIRYYAKKAGIEIPKGAIIEAVL